MWITVDRKALLQALNFCTSIDATAFFQFEVNIDQLHVKSYGEGYYCWKLLALPQVMELGQVKVNNQLLAVVKGIKDKQLMLRQASTYLEVSGLDSSQTFRVPIYSWDYKPHSLPLFQGDQSDLDSKSLESYFEVASELNCIDNYLYLFQGRIALQSPFQSNFDSALTNTVYKALKKYFSESARCQSTDDQLRFESSDQHTLLVVNKTKINIDLYRQSAKLFDLKHKQFEMTIASSKLALPIKELIAFLKILAKKSPNLIWRFQENKLTFTSIEKQKNEFTIACEYEGNDYSFVSSVSEWLNLFKIIDKEGAFKLSVAESQKLYFQFDSGAILIFSALSPKQVRV